MSLVSLALAADPARFHFDRVDLLSADPGTFVNADVPAFGAYPLRSTIRFVEQVKVVFALPQLSPRDGLFVGASLSSQSFGYERRVLRLVSVGGALHTSLLLPRGALAEVSVHPGPVRLGLGVSVQSSATWASLDWRAWHVYPTLAFGIGREQAEF